MERLRITEIFFSLQGETRQVGLPTVFIRLTGCPLRCQYCDTSYAFHGGEWKSIEQILAEIKRYRTQHVTVSGGEPLAQKSCLTLLTQLCDAGYSVSLETSGAMSVEKVDIRVNKVLDLKCPGSGEVNRNHWENLNHLQRTDQIKFVLCHREDYEWAVQVLNEHRLFERCEVLFSPSYQQLEEKQLAEWILSDQLPVRFQMQLHKFLWGEAPGH